MEAIHRITRVTATKWTWLWHCWRLRDHVVALVRALEASPTNLELAELKAAKAKLECRVRGLENELERAGAKAAEAERTHAAEYAKLKAKYDRRLRATETEQVEAVKTELRAERDARHLVEMELKALNDKLEDQASEFKVARDGNQALLRFIHTRHRLNIKFDPNTIRAALQNADRNGGKR